jgi:hypothetical protein
MSTKPTEAQIDERVRQMATKPVNRKELNYFIDSMVEAGSPLHFVMTSYRASLDGLSVDKERALQTGLDVSGPLIDTVESKSAVYRTHFEKMAIRFLGRAIYHLSGDQDADSQPRS